MARTRTSSTDFSVQNDGDNELTGRFYSNRARIVRSRSYFGV